MKPDQSLVRSPSERPKRPAYSPRPVVTGGMTEHSWPPAVARRWSGTFYKDVEGVGRRRSVPACQLGYGRVDRRSVLRAQNSICRPMDCEMGRRECGVRHIRLKRREAEHVDPVDTSPMSPKPYVRALCATRLDPSITGPACVRSERIHTVPKASIHVLHTLLQNRVR